VISELINKCRKKNIRVREKKQKNKNRVPTRWRRRTGRPTIAGTLIPLAGFWAEMKNIHMFLRVKREQREDRREKEKEK